MKIQNQDFEAISKMLDARKEDTLSKRIRYLDEIDQIKEKELETVFMLSPSDLGVCRNGGRRGAQYGPDAIMTIINKMIDHEKDKHPLGVIKVGQPGQELEDFDKAQEDSSKKISNILKNKSIKNLFHIGGGHDHIYSLLKGLETAGHKKITVINIDAHCDTRTDEIHHSGTPFKQFADETKTDFEIIQIGTHVFSNTLETLEALTPHTMKILNYSQLLHETDEFRQPLWPKLERELPFQEGRTYVLSLDADVFDNRVMEGVSAVNYRGLAFKEIQEIFKYFTKVLASTPKICGIYEYNPVYDNLSQKGARVLSYLIYLMLH